MNPWLTLADGDGQTVWVSLDHVRQVLFTEERGAPLALLWCHDDLWEIADPAGLARLRRYLEARALG